MRALITAVVLAVGLGGTMGSARAQAPSDQGTLIRLDPPARVVTLEDGRMYRAVAGTAFLADSRAETFDGLRPGVHLIVIGGEPVVYRQGRYIALPPLPPGVDIERATASIAPPAPSTVEVAPHSAAPAAASIVPAGPPVAWRPAAALPPPSALPAIHGAP